MNEGYDQARKEHDHLLSITLSDINAVPVVHYKGKQVDKKIRVSFDWKTNNNCKSGSYIHIEHMEPEEKLINTKIIQHNHPIVIKE
ncbi:hypothetical protein BAMA_12550 [Bacillus manliponensis]|uniref:Uncharacterized protein n=2 Tax=Bacillus manliponensis TaxID=574376 RepID=A0A073JR63_9BACI|nr:hypothetical protein BAMA_12550 [Bacillus manliponensis]